MAKDLGLTGFRIERLHGKSVSLDLSIENDRVVIVGPNGAGKTTVIKTLYLTLSQQWEALRAGPYFGSIQLRFGDKEHTITQTDIRAFCKDRGDQSGRRGRIIRFRHEVRRLTGAPPPPGMMDEIIRLGPRRLQDYLSRHYPSILPSRWARPINYLFEDMEQEPHLGGLFDRETSADGTPDPVAALAEHLKHQVSSRILYMPTYRRIEQEFTVLFPGLAEMHQPPSQPDSKYIELVKFGMEDVKEDLKNTLTGLNQAARTLLNQLAGNYLRDVIRNEQSELDLTAIISVPDATLERVLSRVEERTLDAEDRTMIRRLVERLRAGNPPGSSDRFIARVLSKLIDLDKSLTLQEQNIKAFALAVSGYLVGKTINYDERNYTVTVRSNDGTEIDWKHLSSGEKQIASLFSQIYLRPVGDGIVVVIDEPELSLSLTWQKRLLPDLLATARCSFLAAATHSPFIFENELDHYTRDLGACTSVIPDVARESNP